MTKQNETIGQTVSDLLAYAELIGLGSTTQPITICGTAADAVSIRWDGTVGSGSSDDYQIIVYVIDGELVAGGLHRSWDYGTRRMSEWTAFDAYQIRGC